MVHSTEGSKVIKKKEKDTGAVAKKMLGFSDRRQYVGRDLYYQQRRHHVCTPTETALDVSRPFSSETTLLG
jgi:hypothetical protein